MAKLLTLKLDQIAVPERLRDVDDAHAYVIGASMEMNGQINPVTVRATPNAGKGKTPWTLVAGAHRYRGAEMRGLETIDALAVEADKDEAALIEIEENLFRNDMSKLERAIFVQTYRDLWERKYGRVQRGGNQSVKLTLCPDDGEGQTDNLTVRSNIAEELESEPESGFFANCANRLGMSVAAVKRANRIAANLPRDLRRKLTGTPIADNQSQLLRLASLEPQQRQAAATAFDAAGGDFAAMMNIIEDRSPEAASPEDKSYERLVNAWGRAPEAVRERFCAAFKLSRESD